MTILNDLKIAAADVFKDNPIIRDLCIAQGIQESNLFGTPSRLAGTYYNLFGIKKVGTAGIVVLQTFEYVNGKKVVIKASFGSNKCILDSVLQYQHVLKLPRYQKVWESETFSQAAYNVFSAGYCTDPFYPSALISIHNELLSHK